MNGISETLKHIKGKNFHNRVVQGVVIACATAIFAYAFIVPGQAPVINKSVEIPGPTIDDVRAAYDPIINKEKLAERMAVRCTVSTPTREEAERNPHGWVLSRYVSYHNIVAYLEKHLANTDRKYYVHDFGSSLFLKPFKDRMIVNRSGYPDVNIHRTPYADETYDIIAADQVIEHIPFPHVAVLELKRILKPGGLMILTTCAYNPYHGTRSYGDYWRFMPEGLKTLSLPLDGGIKICGGWGTKEVVATRAKLGLLTDSEKSEFARILPDAASTNHEMDPFTTWIIMQK